MSVTDTGSDRFAAAARPARRGDTASARFWERLRQVVGAPRLQREEAQAIESIGRPVSTGRRVAVAAVRGGAGATTVAALLALTYATYRSDPVLAVDGIAELGTLAARLGVPEADGAAVQTTLGPSLPTEFADVADRLPEGIGGLRILPAPAPGTDPAEQIEIAGALSRFFGVAVLDRGPAGAGRHAALDALAVAHAAVLVCPASVDGLRALDLAVADLRYEAGEDATARLTAVLVSHNPANEGLDIPRAVAAARSPGVAVLHLDYDRHLAAGAPLVAASIAAATRRTAVAVGARTLHRARQAPRAGL